jgi:hypothetical protein
MHHLQDFFDPINVNNIVDEDYIEKSRFANRILINSIKNPLSDLGKAKIAIFGVSKNNKGELNPADLVRKFLYSFFTPFNVNIIDLGNLKKGKNINDNLYGVREVISYLHSKKIISIILGDNNNLPFASYLSFEEIKNPVNIVSIDSAISLKQKEIKEQDIHYLPKIVLRNNNSLFNFSLLGYQSYLVSPDDINTLNRLFFDAIRLGVVKSNISEIEPLLRDANIVAIHLNSIQGNFNPEENLISPNGLDGREICQLARYAGAGERTSSFGLYGLKNNNSEAILTAQAIWYFLEGFSQRTNEIPSKKAKSILKFHVEVGKDTSITFFKSSKSERWWMEVPYPKSGFSKSLIISCSYSDYQKACNGEVPDRWWKFFQKIC